MVAAWQENSRLWAVGLPLVEGAGQVRSGCRTKNVMTIFPDSLPPNLSIRDHIEFAFSKWISYAYLGCYPYREPFNSRRSAMKLSKVVKIWIDYHKTHSKKNTVRAYGFLATMAISGVSSEKGLPHTLEYKPSTIKPLSSNSFVSDSRLKCCSQL